jgi:pyruvate kinase
VYFRNSKPTKDSPTYLSDTTCFNAVKLSEDIRAKAINGMTYSGYTAFLLASFRPKADIHIFTNNRSIINSLSLIWGVQAYYYDSYESTDDTISDIIDILLKKNKIKKGEYIINTASMPIKDRGRTNMIKLSVA